MSAAVDCARCGQRRPAPASVPHPDPLGAEIRERVCLQCWGEWERAEVMVINELRLDFMDPRSHEILVAHLREFLCLDPPPAGTPE